MRSVQIFVILGLLAIVSCDTLTHVNPNGPPAHSFKPHTVANVKGHRFYHENESDQIYEGSSPMSDAQLAALKIRAKQIKQIRAEHAALHPHKNETMNNSSEMATEKKKLERLHALRKEPKKTEDDLKKEQYDKHAFIARLKLEKEAAKAQEINNDKLWKLRNIHIQKHAGLKKEVLKEKFDDWFDEMFRKMFREMFAKTTSETAVFYFILFYFLGIDDRRIH